MRFRWLVLGTLLAAAPAQAFEIETPLSESCHEDITRNAALDAGFPAFSQAPDPTDEQRRAMNDLVFDLPRRDPWTLALLIGVRSNDLGDRAPTDIDSLILIHDDTTKQDAHCIRRESDDGTAGDVSALAACRAFILRELETGGLLGEQLDLVSTEGVRSFFKFRGAYEIQLPRFAYRLGRASHAMEDSFAHSMRDTESGHVRTVLNYIDAFGKGASYDPDRDGYQHLSTLDDCLRPEANQVARVRHAREAVAAMYAAIADPAPGRRARVEAAVDAALILIPNCTPENNYCDAPELEEPTGFRTFGCDASGASGIALILVLLGSVIALRRRRTRGVATVVLMLALVPGTLRAQPAPAPAPDATQPAETGQPVNPAPMPDPEDNVPAPEVPVQAPPTTEAPAKDLPAETQDQSDFARWHFDMRAGGAWDDPAIAGSFGIGVDYKKWTFGLLAEWNPWMSLDKLGSTRLGVANAYLTFAYRWYHSSKISLSTRIEVGSSTMLFELLGVDKYTTGIYVGGALTSVRFPINSSMSLTFDPIHFAVPAPRPFGLPFFYKQYRVAFGLEIAL